jgi:hypothetical protein
MRLLLLKERRDLGERFNYTFDVRPAESPQASDGRLRRAELSLAQGL